MSKTQTTVIYHDHCSDGFTAAWIVACAIPGANLVPANYGDPIPQDIDGHDVFVVDFCFSAEDTLTIAEHAASLVVLDHHKTSQAALEGLQHDNLTVVFDMERSGAQIAWDWFHASKFAPALVEYVADRDLWKWELPGSRAYSEVVFNTPRTLEEWSMLADTLPLDIIERGEAMLETVDAYVKTTSALARSVRFNDIDCKVVNATPWHVSELLHELCADVQFAMSWTVLGDGKVAVSFRSREDGADVSEIAKTFGGGGHAHAAGARITLSELPSLFESFGLTRDPPSRGQEAIEVS